MPSEIRYVMFQPPEVLEAIQVYKRRMGAPLSPGSVVACGTESAGPGEPIQFRIKFTQDRSDASVSAATPEDIVVAGPALAAALLLYCKDKHIPMPMRADKSLQMFGEQLCLVATFNPGNDQMPHPGVVWR
jgi:hypothetical protein